MSRIDACYAHLVFSPCAVGALLKQDSISAAGIPWWLRHSCHPTQLARNSVHKCPKPTSRGRFRRFMYTPTASFRAVGPTDRDLRALAQPPAAWRGVVRARLPSWATFHSAPQAGGRLRPTPPGRRRDEKAQSARRGSRRLRLSVRRRARLRPSARPRGPPPQPRRRPPQVRPGNRRAPAAARDVAADARSRPCE